MKVYDSPLQRYRDGYQCVAGWGVYYELLDKDIRGINQLLFSTITVVGSQEGSDMVSVCNVHNILRHVKCQDTERIQRENHFNQVDECKRGDGTGRVYHYLKFDQWSSGIIITYSYPTTRLVRRTRI